jgi:tetratricopeptide (TPR) repeat protein
VNFPATALAATIHADRGEDEAAGELFDRLVEESQRVVIRGPSDLEALSRAVLFVGGKSGIQEGEKDLIAAQKAKGGPDVDVALGWLYLKNKYLFADAVLEFKAATKKRPGYVPALVGLHAAYSLLMKRDEAKTALDLALSNSPSDPDALAARVQEDLYEFHAEKAAEKIARGLKVNPNHKPLLALAAAREIILSRKEEGARLLERILKLDPTYGQAYRIVASVLNERRRWPECLEMMIRAVEIDPKDPALFDDYAKYALYLGQNAVAEEILTKADDADVFSCPWRHNIRELLWWVA